MISDKKLSGPIDIHIDTEHVSLSKIYVNGEQVFNVHSLTIYADIHNRVEVVFGTSSERLKTNPYGSVDMFLHPACPNCGFEAPEIEYTTVESDGTFPPFSSQPNKKAN